MAASMMILRDLTNTPYLYYVFFLSSVLLLMISLYLHVLSPLSVGTLSEVYVGLITIYLSHICIYARHLILYSYHLLHRYAAIHTALLPTSGGVHSGSGS